MIIRKRFFILILLPLVLSGCITTRLHYFGETPNQPGRYPVFGRKDSLKGFLDTYRSAYDVTFYGLDLTLDPFHKRLGGTVEIQFRALAPASKIRFDLRRNLDISSVTMNSSELSFSRENMAVFVDMPEPLVAGRSYSMLVSYSGRPAAAAKPPWKGGMVWKKDSQKNPWVGVTCENEGGSIWFPCKDHLSDEPDSVRLRMSVPEGLFVVSNGKMESHISANGKEIFTWCTHYPINIYNITFYAGNFAIVSDTMVVGNDLLHLDYYVMPENAGKAKKHMAQVRDVISVYSRCFGPYPWMREGYKLVESPYEGMEHQTAIAYGSGYENIPWMGGDYIIIHEAAHEWWGNAVSVSDFSDIWLQEGFATYSEAVYVESKKGYDTALIYINFWLASTIRNKYPVVGPKDVSYWDYRDGDVYGKGAMILHTIRNVINDSTLFFDILQTFYREHAAKFHVTTADFKEVVEKKTGENWDKFFEAYLYSREVPVLKWYFGSYDYGIDGNSGQKRSVPFVAARWLNVPDGFTMPVTLTCKESGVTEIINVTTSARIYYLRHFSSCDRLQCNGNRSYFTAVTGADLLQEAERKEPIVPAMDVIADNF
jgi:aminopeptidase N